VGLGLLTVLVVPGGHAEPLRTPAEEDDEEEEDEDDQHRHALEGGEGDASIRMFLRIFHPHKVPHRGFRRSARPPPPPRHVPFLTKPPCVLTRSPLKAAHRNRGACHF
jgi:hypothetical protein